MQVEAWGILGLCECSNDDPLPGILITPTPCRFAQAAYVKALARIRAFLLEAWKLSFLKDGAAKGRPMRRLLLLCAFCLVTGCGGMANTKRALQIKLSDIQIDEKAVEQMTAHIAVPTALSGERVPESLKILFSFLAQTRPGRLVETKPHASGRWQLDQIYLFEDCVAVQFTEGHYLETIFFVRNRTGWRIAGRIRPEDYQ